MNILKKAYSQWHRLVKPPPRHGPAGIRQLGHREYVGGLWEEIGTLQFEFLKSQGMEAHHVVLDIACGCLRAGRLLIPFLDKGNYLGIDKEEQLIEAGKREEVGDELLSSKQPQFVVSSDFDFSTFGKQPDIVIAQSLFTHLDDHAIQGCLESLRSFIQPNGVFFATYFLAEGHHSNPREPHDHLIFRYSREEVAAFGISKGWEVEIIGDWGHPRNQQMVRYTPKAIGG